MSDLLSAADRAAIRAAIKDVTDTFMKTPVLYRLGGGSLDRFNEDRADKQYTNYDLLGLTEYEQEDGDKIKVEVAGAVQEAEVKVTFNLEDLITQELVSNVSPYVCKMNDTKDRMTVRGVDYRVILVSYDGPLDDKNVLVVVYGRVNR